jgi:heat shock protein HslJ
MKLHLITFIFTAIVLNSCGPSKSTDPMSNDTTVFSEIPTETFWQLESLEGKDFSNFKNGDNKVGFTLFEADNRISGFAGCNHFFGTYNFEEGNRIGFSGLGSTKMACPSVEFNENEFLKIFGLADNYTLNGNTLSLNVGRRAPLAVFKKVEKSTTGITEKYWKLKTLEGKDIKMGRNQEKEVYFILKTNESAVTGFAGCNDFFGTYTLEKGNRIRFSEIGSTLKVCPDVDFNESDFFKVFELTDSYKISGDTLELYVGRRAPLAVFEAVYF